MKKYHIAADESLITPMSPPNTVYAESEQDALELWRLQHPQLWDILDLKTRTIDGIPVYIKEVNMTDSSNEENIKEKMIEMARKNIFHCTEQTPYDPQTTPDGMVMHMTVDHFENGDVVCAHCHRVLFGPNQNI